MRPHTTLTVISLGGGVQSSVMALMASQGLPPTSTASPTAPSSPTPVGSRPASMSTWRG